MTIPRFSRRGFLAGSASLALMPQPAGAAPRAELWERWLPHAQTSQERLDHSAWRRFLSRYLLQGPITLLAYGAVTAADQRALADYLASLSTAAVSSLSRAEQFAYWVNLYNALTVKTVLDHYPVASITAIDISPGLFANGPWGAKLVTVEGEKLSLDDIEHRILRPIWRDPRIHYAVNCASIGCPNLQPLAFTAQNSEALLEAGARAYVNHPRGAQLFGQNLRVSSIYQWFKEDFGSSDAGVIDHLRLHAEGDLAAGLADTSEIAGHDYDWSLNEATT